MIIVGWLRRSPLPAVAFLSLFVALLALVLAESPGRRTSIVEAQECEGGAYAQALIEGAPRVALEVAETDVDRARGLMFREWLPWDQGMLFVFERGTNSPFWMGNTLIPLSIAFILEDGTILDIQDMEPLGVDYDPRKIKYYGPPGYYLYALETNQGWFAANNVQPGDRLLLCLGR